MLLNTHLLQVCIAVYATYLCHPAAVYVWQTDATVRSEMLVAIKIFVFLILEFSDPLMFMILSF